MSWRCAPRTHGVDVPDPIQEEQCEEDGCRKPKIQSQHPLRDDVRRHGEEHSDRSQQPSEPALVHDLCVGIADLDST